MGALARKVTLALGGASEEFSPDLVEWSPNVREAQPVNTGAVGSEGAVPTSDTINVSETKPS